MPHFGFNFSYTFCLSTGLSLNVTIIGGRKTDKLYITLVELKPCLHDKLPIIFVNDPLDLVNLIPSSL